MRFEEKLKHMVGRVVGEIGQEMRRLGVQGSAELGSAIFTGQAYVPYGQGQNRRGAEHGMEGMHDKEKEPQRENNGRSM